MLCSQFLANALRPLHPSHEVVMHPLPWPRNQKDSLKSKFVEAVSPYLVDGIVPQANYKKVLSDIHTSAVKASIDAIGPNRVLGSIPLAIAKSESCLPRIHRTTLAQLRSGHCKYLKTYQKLIRKSPDDQCPDCQNGPHTTAHLFQCPASPTDLQIRDLWRHPCKAISFLASLPSFRDLPPLVPPLPPPPPEPPPPPLIPPSSLSP